MKWKEWRISLVVLVGAKLNKLQIKTRIKTSAIHHSKNVDTDLHQYDWPELKLIITEYSVQILIAVVLFSGENDFLHNVDLKITVFKFHYRDKRTNVGV